MAFLRPPSLWLLAACLLALGAVGSVQAQPPPIPPAPQTLVNDYAELLSAGERTALERKLVAYDDSTSNQITVVTLPTLGGADAGDYATNLGRAWGVGQEGADNGLVLLVSVEDRQLFIATGFGMEAVVTDVAAGQIIRNVIAPNFRAGRYYAGLDQATDAIMQAAAGEFSAADRAPGGGDGQVNLVLLFIVLIIVFVVLTSLSGRHGGPGSGDASRPRGRSRGPGIIVLPGGWSGGGGGWSGGGGFGGGGFGGFGGGGFGGGGAGGGW
ncbi:MAG: TPM domain-containing protein [Rhodothermaceae bacterium]|nr:TPM domain-containing protein [Rhodothermaceae bacterium]